MEFLHLFYYGRYSDLDQRNVCYFRLIFNLINHVLVTSEAGSHNFIFFRNNVQYALMIARTVSVLDFIMC